VDRYSRNAWDVTVKHNRDIVAGMMTPADISEAQQMARDWMAIHPAQ